MSLTAARQRGSAVVLSFALAASLFAPRLRAAEPPADAAARLTGRALGATPMLDDLRELCDRIGGRPDGSAAYARAVDWAAAKLREAGADRVAVEPFPMKGLWLPVSAEAAATAPESFPIRVVAAPGSPSTPAGGVEAPVVDAGDGSTEAFARLGAAGKGAIALVRNPEMLSANDLFGEYTRNGPLIAAATKAGVAAVLLQSSRPRGLLYRHPVTTSEPVVGVPVAMASREHFDRLARLAAASAARVRLSMVNRTGGAYESRNVVAEVRGRERPEEVVLLGAHLDAWDLGTGALDDGVNVAMLIDLVRGLKELGLAPRRTVRVVLFGGEENGMWGSAGYVKTHAREMDAHVAVAVFDVGAGRTSGFWLNGRKELDAPVLAALAPVAGLGAFRNDLEAIDGTDNLDFLLSGVPNLVAIQDWGPYLPEYHAESDVFERVDPREARANAAIASALAWGLAERAERPARRQTKAEVDALLVEAKLVEQMKAFGQWDDWLAGRRGAGR